MAKTDTTKAIEQALREYHPAETAGIRVNKFRQTHTAFEVPVICGSTKGGLVDCMRIQEYFSGIHREQYCRLKYAGDLGREWAKAEEKLYTCPRGHAEGQKPDTCDEAGCRYRYIREVGRDDILVTCYEIKVTKADFKSKNGHNFVGNLNYYVIPKEIYPEVADMVPEDIGIILYLSAGTYVGLRKKKDATFRPLTDADQKWFILSVMKRLEETTWKERLEGLSRGLW